MDWEYEWVPYQVEITPPYVNNSPPKTAVEEVQSHVEIIDIAYTEYEYETEYEYAGMMGGDIGSSWELGHEDCTDLEILDCDNNCAPAYWIANGLCDDGEEFHHGYNNDNLPTFEQAVEKGNNNPVYYNFNCDSFWYDGGDCTEKQDTIDFNYQGNTILGGTIYLQKVAPSAPVLAIGVLAVVAVVGAVMKR